MKIKYMLRKKRQSAIIMLTKEEKESSKEIYGTWPSHNFFLYIEGCHTMGTWDPHSKHTTTEKNTLNSLKISGDPSHTTLKVSIAQN